MQMFRKSTGPGVKRCSRFQSCSFMYVLLLLSHFSRVQLCADPIDGSPPGFPIPEILQARTLEWVAISFSNAWKWKVKVKMLSCVWLLVTPWTEAYQAPLSMGFSKQEYWSGVPLPSPMYIGSHLTSLRLCPPVRICLKFCLLKFQLPMPPHLRPGAVAWRTNPTSKEPWMSGRQRA